MNTPRHSALPSVPCSFHSPWLFSPQGEDVDGLSVSGVICKKTLKKPTENSKSCFPHGALRASNSARSPALCHQAKGRAAAAGLRRMKRGSEAQVSTPDSGSVGIALLNQDTTSPRRHGEWGHPTAFLHCFGARFHARMLLSAASPGLSRISLIHTSFSQLRERQQNSKQGTYPKKTTEWHR